MDEQPELSEGTRELGVSGNASFAEDTAYNVDLSYGYFFVDDWEVGLTANSFGQEDFNLGAGIFIERNYAVDDSQWVPYIGAAAKWARASTDTVSDSSFAYGGEFGLKYFIRSNVSIFTGFNFEFAPNDVFGVGEELKTTSRNLNIGLRFYF